jgi:magnesium-transporting ATPase (P-type)
VRAPSARQASSLNLPHSIFVLAEIFVLYAGFRYSYRRGLDNILVLLIGGIPIAMPTVLSVTLAVGAQQLAKYKAIVTRASARLVFRPRQLQSLRRHHRH